MVNEIYTVRIANQFGEVVRSKRVMWTEPGTEKRTIGANTLTSTVFLIMPKLRTDEWELIKIGGNRRFRKIWMQSIDGAYVLYASVRQEIF